MGYVNVSVDVDIDLDCIDDDNLVDELISRSLLSDKYIKKILDAFGVQLHPEVNSKSRTSTLSDKMKYEYLMNIFDKYNLTDIERLLPE